MIENTIEHEGAKRVVGSFVDSFNVCDWVSSKIYKRGVDYYSDDRVVAFELGDDNSIHAEVEGADIYSVDISWDEDGEPLAECTCPFDWEPLCKHAVAAILFWQERGKDGEIGQADRIEEPKPGPVHFDRDAYIAEIADVERKRRRSKKALDQLKILARPKGSICGVYEVSSGTYDANYTVTVRDAGDLSYTTCNCPDYLVNELGTCKHIELVKAYLDNRLKKRGGSMRRDRRVWISIMPKDSYGAEANLYEEIHIHASDRVVRERLFSPDSGMTKAWTSDGYLVGTNNGAGARENFARVLKMIGRCFKKGTAPEIVVVPAVHALVTGIDADRTWKERIDGIIRSPKKSSEWRELKNSLPIKLYDYQEEGILFAVRNRMSFIGDDMGLGKTIQAIVAAMLIKRFKGKNRVIIFCPASLKYQWKREIEKISGEEAVIVQGHSITRRDIYRTTRAMFIIVNYELIFRDEESFHELQPDMIILDEAQRIKNWETKTAKGIKRLSSEFALVLTGTPFENKLVELQSLCEFLHPRALGPMWRLMPTYGNLDSDEHIVGFSNLSGLRSRLAPFFLRRDKDGVMSQLPEKVTNEYTVEISRVQLKYHDDYKSTVASLLTKAKKRPLTPEETKRLFLCLTCMRIVSNALAQHDWKRHKKTVDVPGPLSLSQIRGFHSPKLLEFRSVMEELLEKPDAKFVIFSQWERMLLLAEASIRDILMTKEMESVIFSGSLATGKRPEVIDRFINDPRLRIFFSTDAGGLGLNLQESASYVINLEMPWNPAVLNQRIGRVHRLGQRNTVNVINLISTGCIEERVYAAVGNKRKLFEGLFDGETESVKFEEGSTFIDRLREIMGDAGKGDGGAGEAEAEVGDEIDVSAAMDSVGVSVPTADAEVVTDGNVASQMGRAAAEEAGVDASRTIDLTGILNALGSWFGNKEMARAPAGTIKIGIENANGDVNISIKRPPKDLARGLKDFLTNMAGMIEACSVEDNR